jgi:protein-S-isoprenylcysteine O-methyltransferase Ste14
MPRQKPAELLSVQPDVTGIVRAGEWLFRHRTATAVPLAAAIFALRIGTAAPSLAPLLAGICLMAGGEGVRLWSVRQIGAISRTRSHRLGPLVESGPFARVRNPLYLGNIALWSGFAMSAGLRWLAPMVALLLAAQYHAIVRWEEHLLAERFGAPYRAYQSRVPRWLPRLRPAAARFHTPSFSWSHTLFSERGTLVAIAAGFLLLWLRDHF